MPAKDAQSRPATGIVVGIDPDPRTPREIRREYRALFARGTQLRPDGTAKEDPSRLLADRYLPRHKVSLFDAEYYLADFRYEEGLNYFIAYVGIRAEGRIRRLHPRVFYKDSTLVWRVASHVIRTEEDDWIGKGDVRWVRDNGGEHLVSDEDTTNLPYEIQAALDEVSRRAKPRRDDDGVALVLRNAPPHRVEPYADFTTPRLRAAARARLNGGRPVARITRRADPSSLRFARGFEPDLREGLLEVDTSASKLYGGEVRKYRFVSTNRMVQYQFVASPTHVWINPPQALTTEITTYGLRALHVPADEDIFIPGYEYHFLDETVDPPELHTQIPAGFVGAPSPIDHARADASPWIEALPVIRDFRRFVLGSRRRR